MVVLAIAQAGYEPPTTDDENSPGGFVPSPGLPDRYQASRGNEAWQRSLRLNAQLRRGHPRLN